MDTGRERLPTIDYLKAVAILAVVFTHAAQVTWTGPATPWDLYLSAAWVSFHIPTFLFVSGFLYASRQPLDVARLGSRLSRVLLPYVLASLLVQILGLGGAESFGDVAFQLVTGSALGIYYYVILIVCCIPVAWPLSRMSMGAIGVLWGALLAYTVAAWLEPSLRASGDIFWALRNPLEGFRLGYFVSGWLVALGLPWLSGFAHRQRRPLVTLAVVALLFGLGVYSRQLGLPPGPVVRMVYAFAVIGLIVLLTRARSPSATVRFLSDASLAIYLLHNVFQQGSESVVSGWHPAARILTQAAVGLAGAGLVAWGGRRLLAPARARAWLGA